MPQGGGSAESRVKLRHGDLLVVDSVAGTCQLGALRRFLGEGFQAHLQHNPLLHQACIALLRTCALSRIPCSLNGHGRGSVLPCISQVFNCMVWNVSGACAESTLQTTMHSNGLACAHVHGRGRPRPAAACARRCSTSSRGRSARTG